MFKKGDKIISFAQHLSIEALVAGEIIEVTEPTTTEQRLAGGQRTYTVQLIPEARALLPKHARNDGLWFVYDRTDHIHLYDETRWQVVKELYKKRQAHFVDARNAYLRLLNALT